MADHRHAGGATADADADASGSGQSAVTHRHVVTVQIRHPLLYDDLPQLQTQGMKLPHL